MATTEEVMVPDPLVVTSVTDGQHSPNSLHYKGLAFDFRSHDLANGRKLQVHGALRHHLGPDFDVILEALNTPNEHFHVEYDPK
jgi:hypothetical protein